MQDRPQSQSGDSKDSKNSTSVIFQAFPVSDDDIQVPGPVVNLILDYDQDHKEESLNKDLLVNELPIGNIPLVKTVCNQVQLNRLRDLHIAILSGDLESTKKQVNQEPRLLLLELEEKECLKIQGPSGHKASVTAYRTALATEDTELALWLQTKLIEVAGKEAADRQFNKQFPSEWKEIEEKQWTPIFTQLNNLAASIRVNREDILSTSHPEYKLTIREGSPILIDLNKFRILLEAKLNEIVTIGRHFNPRLLLEAFKKFAEDYPGKRDWIDPRAVLFWQQVIGYIQRVLPTNLMEAFCTDFDSFIKNLQQNTSQSRLLEFKIHPGLTPSLKIYPLTKDSGLGYTFALYGTPSAASLASTNRFLRGFAKFLIHKEKLHQEKLCRSEPVEISSNKSNPRI